MQFNQIETQNKEYKQATIELESKLQKYRKLYRDVNNDMNVSHHQVIAKESIVTTKQQQIDKLDTILHQVRVFLYLF